MIEIYKTPSKEIQEVILANLTYETVIDGLNEYFASEPRNDYITVKMEIDKQDSELYAAEAWADILISWLRTEHDIFYRPGMTLDQVEAARSAAKMCCLRAYIKDEICKRGLWCGADEDVPELVDTLFKAYDECVKHRDKNRKDAVKLSEEIRCVVKEKESAIEKLKERITELESESKAVYDEDDIFRTRALKAEEEMKKIKEQLDKAAADYQALSEENQKLKASQKSDINALIRDYCTKNGIIAPSRYFSEKACVEYLFSVINLKQKDRSFTIVQDLYRDIFKRQPDGLSAEDIANKILDKVLETEDLLHKSVDSVNKECKAVGKQMVDDYEKDLLKFIYKEYKDRIGLSDNTITYNPPSIRNTVLKIISDYARSRTRVDILETQIKSIFDKYKSKFTVDDYLINANPSSGLMLDCFSAWFRDTSSDSESRGKTRAEIENYKLKLKDYILNDIKKHGYRYDGLETKSIEEIVNWIIEMATCPRNEWAKDEIENLRGQIDRLKGLINAMNEEVKDM